MAGDEVRGPDMSERDSNYIINKPNLKVEEIKCSSPSIKYESYKQTYPFEGRVCCHGNGPVGQMEAGDLGAEPRRQHEIRYMDSDS